MPDYRLNHYVPKWHQYMFFPNGTKDCKFYYLDLKPKTESSKGHQYKRKSLLRWGPPKCFCETDLYTTKFGGWESTEIEEKFFGKIDSSGRAAVEYFSTFQHPSIDHDAFNALLPYFSIQKLRTPKGLAYLSKLTKLPDKNFVLLKLQELQQTFCALWAECVWSIVDASESETKFLLSDHPVTVYNKGCLPASKWCQDFNDPDIWLSGTHTLFPLNLNKLLILTNLAWVRNPYGNPLNKRPNPKLFRSAMFNFMEIQTNRMLSDLEVNQMNFVIKKRAYRYIAAAKEEWLYPEQKTPNTYWNKLGDGYLFMPDPRSVTFSLELLINYGNNRVDSFYSYGRKPWNPKFNDKNEHENEWKTFHAFQGEFARVFGPKRRGLTYEFCHLDNIEDKPDFHAYHLGLENKYKKSIRKR